MELHTLGVDGGYTQQDIIEVAKAFTGWTIQQPRRGGGFEFDERRHVKGPKTILGKKSTKAASKTARPCSICSRRIRRPRRSSPPNSRAASSRRAAQGARRTRRREVPLDERQPARSRPHDPDVAGIHVGRGDAREGEDAVRIRRERAARDRRAIEDGTVLVRNLQGLGMPLYMAQPPTGYIDRADVWVNTGALLNRMNFAVALVNNRLRGVQVDLTPIIGRNPPEIAAARDALLASLLSNEVSDATRATIAKGGEVTQVAALTLGDRLKFSGR